MNRSYPRHMLGSVEVTEPDEQDRRIGSLKKELRVLMGHDAFLAFYKTTSMNGDILEKQLTDKLSEIKPDSLFSEVILLERRQDEILANFQESDNQQALISELAEIETALAPHYGYMSDREWSSYR